MMGQLVHMPHKCDYVQTGVYADKNFTSLPIMTCRICKDVKKVGIDD